MEGDISADEVKRAVWDCGNDKAPGPDGFTFKFLKKYWEVLKGGIMAYINHFEKWGRLSRGCNSSSITLAAKIKDLLSLSDYRPISLIGSLYKIIAKILASRIRMVMGECIDEVQTAFVKGRDILEGPLIVNEICTWGKKRNKKILLFKVDFNKAFDSVNWNFLNSMMQQMNFGIKWRTWMKGCLESARASVLVNGCPTTEFQLEKGVRQGDPLSPFLFILAMEGLNIALKEAVEKGVFQGITIPNSDIKVSHLVYADDALSLENGLDKI